MSAERRRARWAIRYAEEQAFFYREHFETGEHLAIAEAYEDFLSNYDIDDLCMAWRSEPPESKAEAEGWVDFLAGLE